MSKKVKNVLGTFFKRVITQGWAVTTLKTGGRELNTTKEILNEIETFYEELYSIKEINSEILKEVLSFMDKKLEGQHALLSQDFTILEIQEALRGFKRGKSPGLDGLPLEFYMTFWDILAHTVFKEFETLDRLPDSFRIGIVSLLHK